MFSIRDPARIFSRSAHRSASALKNRTKPWLFPDECVATYPLAEQLKKTPFWQDGLTASRAAGARRKAQDELIPDEPRDQTASREANVDETEAEVKNGGGKRTRTKVGTEKGSPYIKADKTRVNIVSGNLCDDILSYIGPSLERHKGCDMIDMNPGAGLWSTKLHDFLQPRSHILFEPDIDFYKPFLEPLASRSNVAVIPEMGYDWANLKQVLTPKHLPHQKELGRQNWGEPVPKNDTLLVTANIAFYPRKRFMRFENFAQLVLFQFVNSVRTQSLFHKYGLVRMLIWAHDDVKRLALPRTIQGRRKHAMDVEMCAEHMIEVAGASDNQANDQPWYKREKTIERASLERIMNKMRLDGVVIPPGRESWQVREFRSAAAREDDGAEQGVAIDRPYHAELEELRQAVEQGKLPRDSQNERYDRFLRLKFRRIYETRARSSHRELLDELQAIVDMYSTEPPLPPEEMAAREAEWNRSMSRLGDQQLYETLLMRDNMRAVQQEPPILCWDRRPFEPLAVSRDEFFPSVGLALLDFQPRASPANLSVGSDEGYVLHLLRDTLHNSSTWSVSSAFSTFYPGAREAVIPACPSLRDVKQGGCPVNGYGELSIRTLNEGHIMDILKAWAKWPARPHWTELVSRTGTSLDNWGTGGSEECRNPAGSNFHT